MLKVTFWGTRGSIPVSGPTYARHGGATTCIELELFGFEAATPRRVIFDCGTGLADMGRARGAQCVSGLIYQTHMHWDHVQGFPFFGALFNPTAHWRLHAVPREGEDFKQVLSAQMSPPTFPVSLEMLPARLEFKDLPKDGQREHGELKVSWCEVWHPSGSTAYRVDLMGRSVVFTGDVEVRRDCEQAVIELARGADVLIMDAQYFEEEYATRQGWGHSTPADAVRVALAAGVKQLLLTHHDPSHDDDRLDEKLKVARALAQGTGLLVDNARDGLTLTLRSSSGLAELYDHVASAP